MSSLVAAGSRVTGERRAAGALPLPLPGSDASQGGGGRKLRLGFSQQAVRAARVSAGVFAVAPRRVGGVT